MTARPKSCLAGGVSAHEGMGYPEVSGVLESSFLVGSFASHKKSRDGERLGGCSGCCMQAEYVSWMFLSFFLLGRVLRGALPVGCTVETKQRKRLRTKTIRTGNKAMPHLRVFQGENGPFPSRSSWENSMGSPRHPEAVALPAGPTAPQKQSCDPAGREHCWARAGHGGHRATAPAGAPALPFHVSPWKSHSSSKHSNWK